MVNSRESLAKIPSMNNDANPYIITLDIYKEGYWAYDISNYYKGRVDDNGTPFMVRWFEHGQLKNVQGLRPFIRGTVGQHTVDDQTDPDNPKVVPSPDCSQIDQTGETTDTAPGGIAIYRMVNACFTQEGMFYGEIGLKDSSGLVLSSVDIAFKVLGGSMNMLGARKFYVSEFEKALDNLNEIIENTKKDFSQELKQVIDDARNAYESETKNAHDSLDALKSQIKANRDEQQNLSQHLAGTEQQIETHDVVTRPEFLDLGNRLNQQVANLRQNKTLYFQNLAELQTQYPNGTDNLCITLDDKHLHVYDYANGTWTDAGATDIITADPATKDAIYQDSSNVAPDPDFKIIDGEWLFASDLGTPNWAFESKTIDNSKVIQMHGYYNQATENNWNNTWCVSRIINIAGQKVISLAWDINAKSAGQPADAHTELQLTFLDKDQNQIGKLVNNVPESQDDKLHLFKWENLVPPVNATFATFAVVIHGAGSVRFAKPRFNFSKTVLPFNIKEQANHVQLINTHTSTSNLVPNANLTNLDLWTIGADAGKTDFKLQDKRFNTSNIIRLTGHTQSGSADYGNQWLTSYEFEVDGFKNISCSWMIDSHLADIATGAFALGFNFFDQDDNLLANGPRYNIQQNTNDFNLFTFENVKVPDNAISASIYVLIHGAGYIDVAYPQANQGERVLPHSAKIFSDNHTGDNLVPNAALTNLKDWHYGNDIHNVKIDLLEQTFNTSHIARLYGHKKDESNSKDFGNAWFTSANVNVQKYLKMKSEWLLDIHLDDPNTAGVSIAQQFFDANNKSIKNAIISSLDNTETFTLFKQICDVPTNAVYMTIYVLINGAGYVDITEPRLSGIGRENFVNKLGLEFTNIGKDLGGTVPYRINKGVFSFDGFHSDQTENNWNNTWMSFGGFKINKNSRFVSFDLSLAVKFLQGTDDNYLRLEFYAYDNAGNQLAAQFKSINPAKNIDKMHHEFWDGLWIPDNATNFNLSFTLHNKGTVSISNINYKINDTYCGSKIPQIFINNSKDLDNNWQNAQFRFIDGSRTLDGYLQLAIQGDSSRTYPKKNFKTKFFTDSNCEEKLKWKPKSNWQANNKFNFKANWIDATQARNLVNAQMIEKATASTPMEKLDETKALLDTQGLGQMEGFPVEVYLADGYYGLFTLNTKKDDKTFGMDSDNPKHEVISVELADQVFRDPKATIDEKNYLTEIHDAPSANVKSNFEKLVQFINQSTPDDFVKHLGDYIDIKSCINTMLYGILSKEYDYYNKSYLLCTWNDGTYFYMVPYDLDSTWGLYWDGSRIVEDGNDPLFDFEGLVKDPNRDSFISNHGQNRLFERIYEHFKPEVKKQYDLLRSTVWKNSDIIQAFKHFIDEIPEAAFEHEQQKWTALPSAKITDFAQIQNFIIQRGNAMDDFMNNHFLTQATNSSNTQPVASQTQPQQGNK